MKYYLIYVYAALMALGAVSNSWAEVDASNKGVLSSVQEYDSSVDDLLLAYLGFDLYESNVVKLKSHGRRFTLIGDHHNNQKFRDLFDQLVEGTRIPERDFALFIEGGPVAEEVWLKASEVKNSPGRIFDLEDQNLSDLTGYIIRSHYLLTLENVDSSEWPTLLQNHEQLLCYEISTRPEIRERLDYLNDKEGMLAPLIMSLKQIADQASSLDEITELLQASSHFSNALWATLYKEMALHLMPNVDLSADQNTLIQATLESPYDVLAFWDFTNEIVFNARNETMRANIDKAIKSLPTSTEIVIFVGAAHVPDIFYGLQAMRPIKDEL